MSTHPDQNTTGRPFGLSTTYEDISNYNSFMESLMNFLNEAAVLMLQVKERSGISLTCSSPIKMPEEDKKQKMNMILETMTEHLNESSKSGDCECDPCTDPAVNSTLMSSILTTSTKSADTTRPGDTVLNTARRTGDNTLLNTTIRPGEDAIHNIALREADMLNTAVTSGDASLMNTTIRPGDSIYAPGARTARAQSPDRSYATPSTVRAPQPRYQQSPRATYPSSYASASRSKAGNSWSVCTPVCTNPYCGQH